MTTKLFLCDLKQEESKEGGKYKTEKDGKTPLQQ